jgi:hypothetical protein
VFLVDQTLESEDELDSEEDIEEEDTSMDDLTIHTDSVLDNLKKKPEQIVKIDGSVIAGARYMWKHKPRYTFADIYFFKSQRLA